MMISYRQYVPFFLTIFFAIWSGYAYDVGYYGASCATGTLALICVFILNVEWGEE